MIHAQDSPKTPADRNRILLVEISQSVSADLLCASHSQHRLLIGVDLHEGASCRTKGRGGRLRAVPARLILQHYSVIPIEPETPSILRLTHVHVGEQRFALANNGSPWRTGFHFAG